MSNDSSIDSILNNIQKVKQQQNPEIINEQNSFIHNLPAIQSLLEENKKYNEVIKTVESEFKTMNQEANSKYKGFSGPIRFIFHIIWRLISYLFIIAVILFGSAVFGLILYLILYVLGIGSYTLVLNISAIIFAIVTLIISIGYIKNFIYKINNNSNIIKENEANIAHNQAVLNKYNLTKEQFMAFKNKMEENNKKLLELAPKIIIEHARVWKKDITETFSYAKNRFGFDLSKWNVELKREIDQYKLARIEFENKQHEKELKELEKEEQAEKERKHEAMEKERLELEKQRTKETHRIHENLKDDKEKSGERWL